MLSDDAISKVAKILKIRPSFVEDMTMTQIIERLVIKFDKLGYEVPDKNALWGYYKDEAVVSYRTFVRRLDKRMSPYQAAMTPPAPTRPFDKDKTRCTSKL